MDTQKDKLYTITKDVKCTDCGSIGAIKFYGSYTPETKRMSHAVGLGGTVPHHCLNCGNSGLIGLSGLEGYKKAFEKEANMAETIYKDGYGEIEGRQDTDTDGVILVVKYRNLNPESITFPKEAIPKIEEFLKGLKR